MAHYLAARPDIFMARKEMHVFGSDLHFGPQFYRRKLEAYLTEFEGWKEQSRGGEASVWYLFSKRAAGELKAFSPDSRIIIMLRDPVEMLHSMYHTFLWDGNEHLKSFESAITASDERRRGRRMNRQTYFAQGLVYTDIIRFEEQVRRYWEVFGRERVHIVIYDDFAADVVGAYRHVLDFLEVNSTRVENYFEPVNANKFVKSTTLRTMLSDPIVRSTILAVRPMMPRGVFSILQKADARLRRMNSRDGERPPLSLEFRQKLERQFAPEVERLSALLGRDLTHWSRGGTRAVKTAIPQTGPAKIASPADCAVAVRNLGLLPGEAHFDIQS